MSAVILDFAAHKAKRQPRAPELRIVRPDELHELFRGFPVIRGRSDGEGGPPPSAA